MFFDIFHHLFKLINDPLIPEDFLVLALSLGLGLVDKWLISLTPVALSLHLRPLPSLLVHPGLHELTLGWQVLIVDILLLNIVEIDLLLIHLLSFNELPKLLNLIFVLLVFFLLHDELSHK